MKQAVTKTKKAVEKVIHRLTAWSYSRWKDYEKCPAYCKYKHILHIREPGSQAIEDGTIAHQTAAHVVRSVLKEFPKELGKFEGEFRILQENKAEPEQEWAFSSDYKQVPYFSREAWLRIKVDAHYLTQKPVGKRGLVRTTVHIKDYKTGKNRPDHSEQRSLYALGAFLMYPDASEVIVEHWYLDTKDGEIEDSKYTANDFPKLKEQWERRTRALLSDTSFAPRPGNYCGWCHFSNKKGGPCQF